MSELDTGLEAGCREWRNVPVIGPESAYSEFTWKDYI